MSAELIGILGVGAALAGVMVSLFAWMRADIGQLRRHVTALSERVGGLETRLGERMAALETELGERINALGERMARLEGMVGPESQAIGIRRPDAAE